MKYYRISMLGIFLLVGNSLFAQISSVQVTGSWNATVTTPLTEAGLNYTSNITSATNQTLVTIVGTYFLSTYSVGIHKQDISWDPNLTVWARRTGSGTTGIFSSITDGLNYFQLTAMSQYFFNGRVPLGGTTRDIPIQYEIRGLSVLIPVRSYSTTIVYTFTDP